MEEEFKAALRSEQGAFGIGLSDVAIERLTAYYNLVLENNKLLHLVAPTDAAEFAVRHILESLTLLEYLKKGSVLADVGSGAGLPSMPCLIVRDDLRGNLIESKQKKAAFLTNAASELGIQQRVSVLNRQFEEAEPGNSTAVTCRALDKFTQKLPQLLSWAGRRELLLFGGKSLGAALDLQSAKYKRILMPLSEQRYLYSVCPKPTKGAKK